SARPLPQHRESRPDLRKPPATAFPQLWFCRCPSAHRERPKSRSSALFPTATASCPPLPCWKMHAACPQHEFQDHGRSASARVACSFPSKRERDPSIGRATVTQVPASCPAP